VVTLWLHCCYTVVALWLGLDCIFEIFTLVEGLVTLATAEEDMPQPPAHEGQNTYWRLSIDHSVTAVQQQRNSSATAAQQQCNSSVTAV
jgi:hypothetical protein